MIYQETYFDDCHGLIPQIVLSAMLLQAGNIRAATYKNALTVDLSDANNFTFNGYFLQLDGILPFVESRYLLTVPSIINRVGAMNSENVLQFSDMMGLPVDGFTRTTDREVTLPTNIENLSTGVLVLEKRLAYLLLLQAKRSNLNILYNYLYYTTLASDFTERINTTEFLPPGREVFQSIVIWFYGGTVYNHFFRPRGRLVVVLQLCMNNLFATYPSLMRYIPITNIFNSVLTFSEVCDWLELEMAKNDPVTLPDLDFDLLVDKIVDRVADLRYIELLNDPQGFVPLGSESDVSSEIQAQDQSGESGNNDVPRMITLFPDNNNDMSPFQDRPSSNQSSTGGGSPKTDPLPPC